MPNHIDADSINLLTLLSFAGSVVAAVLAIDMYRLLRTGQVGNSWRILITASVLFAFTLALRLAESFDWTGLQGRQLSRISELMFVFALAYAFYLQRRAFTQSKASTTPAPSPQTSKPTSTDREPEDLDDLARYYAEGGVPRR